LQQIQWAHASVETANPGEGEEFVRSLATLVAESAPSITKDPEVANFLGGEAGKTFEFAERPANAPAVATDAAVARVIAVVSDVVASRGSGFTAMGVMERRLGLSKDAVVETLLKFSSGKDALADALARLPNPPQKQVLAEISVEVMKTIPAARSNKVLAEVAFRWLGLGDATYGEWFEARDKMIEITESGRLGGPAEKKANAQVLAARLRVDYADLIREFMGKGLVPTAKDIERMHYEYTRRSPSAAALWGFAVIGLNRELDFERYVDEQAERLKQRYLKMYLSMFIENFEKELGRSATPSERHEAARIVVREQSDAYDWKEEARKSGAKPYQGWQEYVRKTGFGPVDDAARYYDSKAVSDAIDKYCPV
jgi:hypothetical protein